MAKRILIVDDDEEFRAALAGTVEQLGYEVVTVENGKSAESAIGQESFDLVVSDIQMPDTNGIELLHYIKRSKPMPVMLMTGFAGAAEAQEAANLGADALLAKPFQREDFVEALKLLLPQEEPGTASETPDEDFRKISIDDFVTGKEIRHDIWVRLGQDRYVKLAYEGQDLSLDRIRAYKSKNIQFLYLRKDDFRKYVGLSVALSKVVTKSAIPKAKKLNLLKHAGEVIAQTLLLNGVDRKAFEDANGIVDTMIATVTEDDDVFNLLSVLNSHGDHLYAHSLAVSLYSVMIGKELGKGLGGVPGITRYKLAMGGLLHDVGKKELDPALLSKPRKDWTSEEVLEYETHPFRGMEILSGISSIPTDIVQIVLQHHENQIGTGFPSAMRRELVHPLARIVSVANEFCELALDSPGRPALEPKEAIERIATIYPEAYDSLALAALHRVFGLEPMGHLKRLLR